MFACLCVIRITVCMLRRYSNTTLNGNARTAEFSILGQVTITCKSMILVWVKRQGKDDNDDNPSGTGNSSVRCSWYDLAGALSNVVARWDKQGNSSLRTGAAFSSWRRILQLSTVVTPVPGLLLTIAKRILAPYSFSDIVLRSVSWCLPSSVLLNSQRQSLPDFFKPTCVANDLEWLGKSS